VIHLHCEQSRLLCRSALMLVMSGAQQHGKRAAHALLLTPTGVRHGSILRQLYLHLRLLLLLREQLSLLYDCVPIRADGRG
jgi:hypothetical protein